MRLLMVLGSLEVGGAERMALELATGLRGVGWDVHAAALPADGPMADAWRASDVPLHAGLIRFRRDPMGAWRVGRLINDAAVDGVLIIDVYRNATICGLWGARLSGRRPATALWCHSLPTGQAGPFVPRLAKQIRARRLGRVLCVADHQRRILETAGLPSDRLGLVRNGVDLERFAVPDRAGRPGRPTLIQVANRMPDKDLPLLLAACVQLRGRGVDFELQLVGRGMDADDVQTQVDVAGLSRQVRCLGPRRDVPGLLSKADAFALASRSEVFNVAAIEAMAAGLPIVVPELPAFAEMIAADEQGLFYPPGDATGLADALARVLGDAALRARLGAAARTRAADFARQAMVDAFVVEMPLA